ncbi:nucleotidyltransferase family protein [bacterium]|nr:nucleotidyltransferase family protein [bacterium]MBU1754252.1 nucleotidyltransferase family protein [bacterium]
MVTIREIEEKIKKNLPAIKNQFKVIEMGIFGSVVRNEQTRKSDIDILVVLEDEHNDLFNFIRLKNYLEDLFHKKVDLVMKEGIKPRIKDKILKEVQYV